MADKKISQLTGATTPLTGTEELAIVQSGSTVKATAQDVADLAPQELPTQVIGDAGNFLQADGLGGVSYQPAGGGVLPVVNTYPVTTPASAGTRFWYKGNEWHYMTQDEIDSVGWTGLVGVGFPAPVEKNYNNFILTPGLKISFQSGASANFTVFYENQTFDCDFLGLGDPTRARIAIRLGEFSTTPYTITLKNVNLLTNLENVGTVSSFIVRYGNLTATAINQLFTDLPATAKTATIDVRNNPGSATCNPTIATAKGYTVLV